jgi:hypothetical protein
VFAYRSEIDAWLKRPSSTDIVIPEASAPASDESETAVAIAPSGKHPIWRWAIATTAVCLVLLILNWRARSSRADEPPARVSVNEGAIVAAGPDGVERWRHTFAEDERFGINPYRPDAEILHGPPAGILVGSMQRNARGSDVFKSGQLLRFSPDGALGGTFGFDEQLAFTKDTYAGPWIMTDFRVEPSAGPEAIAVAAHHSQWWPSIVTVLDPDLKRRGTFVNAGWVEHVRWAAPDRLVIAGFSNYRDGGMIALIDANAPDGQSPVLESSPFWCTTCGTRGPIRYIVLPRSEINRITASPFNRVILQPMPDRVIARTVEMPSDYPASTAGIADALYEFSTGLDFIRASYSDRYWEMHRSLEAQGKIAHGREGCPDRDGPRTFEVWERGTGWMTRSIQR